MIKVIDLFAGPGGFGEGFSSFGRPKKRFSIGVSVEMDSRAHKTLLLRSFYRQFNYDEVPDGYFDFIKAGKFSDIRLDELLDSFPQQGQAARHEALCKELGKDDDEIFSAIENALVEEISDNKPWVLIGGPPCQAYSLVGRARNKGIENYNLDSDKRSKLYKEYLRILARFQPAVFIMENVKGMLSAVVEGDKVVKQITKDLQDPEAAGVDVVPITGENHSYKLYSLTKDSDLLEEFRPEDFLIKCENYGIPQRRHRVIIVGVRDDHDKGKVNLLEFKQPVSVRNAIYDLPLVNSDISSVNKGRVGIDLELQQYDDVVKMLNVYFDGYHTSLEVDRVMEETLPQLRLARRGRRPELLNPDWYYNDRLEGHICNHEPRTHMRSDFLRYFFVCCYGKAKGTSPRLEDFPEDLLPAHKNINSGKFVDRFKVQLENDPATTITSHISKDGHYYIHPDPRQCRSLTVREAARLQTFPDDYFFCGNRTQQYHQVGNAVPPLLARQIAEIVWAVLTK